MVIKRMRGIWYHFLCRETFLQLVLFNLPLIGAVPNLENGCGIRCMNHIGFCLVVRFVGWGGLADRQTMVVA